MPTFLEEYEAATRKKAKQPSFLEEYEAAQKEETGLNIMDAITAVGGGLPGIVLGIGKYVLRQRAASGAADRDAAKDEGVIDRTSNLLERGMQSAMGGADRFTGTLAGSEPVIRRARIIEQAQKQEIAGTTSWEDVKKDATIGNVLKFGIETTIQSLPEMAITAVPFIGVGVETAIQAGRIAQERAENNGQPDADRMDILAAAPAALGSSYLEKVGIKGIGGAFGKTPVGRVLSGTGTEALTETGQSGIEYAGGSLGTKKGATWSEAGEQMLAGAVGGAVGGATLSGTREATQQGWEQGGKIVRRIGRLGETVAQSAADAAAEGGEVDGDGLRPIPPGVVESDTNLDDDDRDSPLPDDLIEPGLGTVRGPEAKKRADDILNAAGMPTTGKKVEFTMPDGIRRTGTVIDAFTTDAGEFGTSDGIKIALDDGTTFAGHFDELADNGVSITESTMTPEEIAADLKRRADEADAAAQAAIDEFVRAPMPIREEIEPGGPIAPPEALAAGSGMDRDETISFIMNKLEGGSKRVVDSGGVTRYGISQNANPDVDVEKLTEAQAKQIYIDRYWNPMGLDKYDSAFAIAAFDTAINHGVGGANKLIARSGGTVEGLMAARRQEYARLIAQDPGKYARYENGWENRLTQLEETIGAQPAGAATTATTATTAAPEGPGPYGELLAESLAEQPQAQPPVAGLQPEIGSDAGNGFFHAPDGYRVRISEPTTGGLLVDKRSEGGTVSGFYVGSDGKMVDADEIGLNRPDDRAKIWTSGTPEQKAEVSGLLRQAQELKLSDPARKPIQARIRAIVTGEEITTPEAAEGPALPGPTAAPGGEPQATGGVSAAPFRVRADAVERADEYLDKHLSATNETDQGTRAGFKAAVAVSRGLNKGSDFTPDDFKQPGFTEGYMAGVDWYERGAQADDPHVAIKSASPLKTLVSGKKGEAGAAATDELRTKAAGIAEKGGTAEFAGNDDRTAIAGPDLSTYDKFHLTVTDASGKPTLTNYGTMEEAVHAALKQGFTPKGEPTAAPEQAGAPAVPPAEAAAAGTPPAPATPAAAADTGPAITNLGRDDNRYSVATGTVLKSQSGRALSPAPKFDGSTKLKQSGSLNRQKEWLLGEAIAEAESAGATPDQRNALSSLKAIRPDNMAPIDWDIINDTLFGDARGPDQSNVTGGAPAQSTKPVTPAQKPAEQEAWEKSLGDPERLTEDERFEYANLYDDNAIGLLDDEGVTRLLDLRKKAQGAAKTPPTPPTPPAGDTRDDGPPLDEAEAMAKGREAFHAGKPRAEAGGKAEQEGWDQAEAYDRKDWADALEPGFRLIAPGEHPTMLGLDKDWEVIAPGGHTVATGDTARAAVEKYFDWRDMRDARKAEAAPPKPTKPAAEPETEKPKRFANNKVFTEDKVAAARERIRAKINRLNAGLDPELAMDGMIIAGAYIEDGVRRFVDVARAVAADLGTDVANIKPYIAAWYDGARNMLKYGGQNVDDMDNGQAVEYAMEDFDTWAKEEAAPEPAAKPAAKPAKPKAGREETEETVDYDDRDQYDAYEGFGWEFLDYADDGVHMFHARGGVDEDAGVRDKVLQVRVFNPNRGVAEHVFTWRSKTARELDDLTVETATYYHNVTDFDELPSFDIAMAEYGPELVPLVKEWVKRNGPENKLPAPKDAVKALRDRFLAGERFATIVEARKALAEITGQKIEPGTPEAKTADETIEAAIVQAARVIAARDQPALTTYRELVDLYSRQPSLNVRSSTSIEQQAYSTPVPLAFLASQRAGIDQTTTVYEPSAGNGMLLIDARATHVTANELNADRAQQLRDIYRGATVTEEDATTYSPKDDFDAVIANPPFGPVKDADGDTLVFDVGRGYTTREIDHAIALKALEAMKDGGKAVLIVGGINKLVTSEEARADAYNGKSKREFYYRLYSDYNVTDHFTVAGELYTKQGAGWPVDVIVIEGRGKSALPLPAVKAPRQFDSWTGLEAEVRGPAKTDRQTGRPDRTGSVGGGPRGPQTADAGTPGGRGEVRNPPGGVGGPPGQPDQIRTGAAEGVRPGPPVGTGGGAPGPAAGAGEERKPVARRTRADLKQRIDENEAQVAYVPASGGGEMGTLAPVNMQAAMSDALHRLQQRVGPIDDFVKDRLGYSDEELNKNFGAEQIDAVAVAIDNMERGSGFIIGDQTGIGKGRVVAAVLRYAIRSGRTPIFVTEKPNLYVDMYRDLTDIGVDKMLGREMNIAMTNSGMNLDLNRDDGKMLKSLSSLKQKPFLQKLASEGLAANDVDILFTTYSQMQAVKKAETDRIRLLRALASGAIIVFDESHNAGGSAAALEDPDVFSRAGFARELISRAQGVFYSSATYAKRPDVMDLYAATDLRLGVDDISELGDTIARGGVPLQQIVATMLARAGQYFRRERSFDGINYNTPPVTVDREQYANASLILGAINAFSDNEVAETVADISNTIRTEGQIIAGDQSIGSAGASSTNFTTVMHNVIDQMLMAFKADAAADMAIEAIKRGEKPVLTVANTMESFLSNYAGDKGLSAGDPISVSFADAFKRYLERTRRITIVRPFQTGPPDVHYITDEELGPAGVAAFNAIMEQIDEAGLGSLPGSPLDYIISKIERAGYKIGEITGRTLGVKYEADGSASLYNRPTTDRSIAGRLNVIKGFNDGSLDAVMLNQSGATGLSLHANKTFKDQRKRRMILVQAEKNIDTHMQMLGRVHRTGQVVLPEYDQLVADIPAEKRPAAVLAKKMASLNANTTASRGSALTAKTVVDFMNQYGDMVVTRMMTNDPQVHAQLGDPLPSDDNGDLKREDAARKVTGRVPMLPLEQQEEIYEAIESEYNSMIEQLDAAGENALEAKTLDLEAKTKSKTEVKPGKGDSPFTEPVYVEQLSVNRIGNPMKGEEVIALVAKNTNQPVPETADPVEALKTLAKGNADAFNAETDKVLEAGRAYARQQVAKIRDPLSDVGLRFQLIERKWQGLRQALRPGMTVKIRTGEQNYYAVITNIDRPGKAANPVAPGSWTATFALVDAARTMSLPFSQIDVTGGTPDAGNVGVEPATRIGPFTIPAAFDEMQVDSREDRTMVTGNIMAGLGWTEGAGAIVNFTREDGTVDQGIFMRRGFDYITFEQAKDIALPNPASVMAWLRETDVAIGRGANGTISLSVNPSRGEIRLDTEKSKARGGEFFLNKKLQALLSSPFISGSGVMRGYAPIANLAQIIEVLQERGAKFIIPSNTDQGIKDRFKTIIADSLRNVPGGSRSSVVRRPTKLDRKRTGRYAPRKYTEDMEKTWQELNKRLAELKVSERVRLAVTKFIDQSEQIAGEFRWFDDGDSLIKVALNTTQTARMTLNHEAIHALKWLGVFTDSEWDALVRGAKADRKTMASIKERYPADKLAQEIRDENPGLTISDEEMAGIVEEIQLEEAVSDRFMYWARGKHELGFVHLAFKRVAEFVKALGSVLRKSGFPTPESVMKAIESGEIGSRPSTQPPVGAPRTRQMVVYHGSPHDFDAFSSEKIGTGEGAQVYGHGLYFTDRREIAEHYKQTLSRPKLKAEGEEILSLHTMSAAKAEWLKELAEKLPGDVAWWNLSGVLSRLRDDVLFDGLTVAESLDRQIATLEKMQPQKMAMTLDEREMIGRFEAAKALKAWGKLEAEGAGRLYEVDIPEDGEYLLWDKPFSEQPKAVVDALQAFMRQEAKPGSLIAQMQENLFDAMTKNWSGKAIYEAAYRPADIHPSQASDALREAGIAGIKYLDQGSRTEGKGTYNYVLFEAGRAKVISKRARVVPLSRDQFSQRYLQHIDLRGRGGAAKDTLGTVQRDGWKAGFGVNLLPVWMGGRGGQPRNIMEERYMPLAGDIVYLVPPSGRVEGGNGASIKPGWKPGPGEAVVVERDGQDLYELYTAAAGAKGTSRQSRVRPAAPAGPTFDDPETEARYQEAREGLGTVETMRERLTGKLAEGWHGLSRHWIHLPNTPAYAGLQQKLRAIEAAPQAAKERTVRMLEDMTKGFDTADLDLFSRKVILDDLSWEASENHELPFGLTPDTLKAELAKLDALLQADPDKKVWKAVMKRKVANRRVAEQLVEAGVLEAESIKNPAYYRHQVLEYARAEMKLAHTAGNKLRTPKWAKRMGSTLDINANLLEAEFDWLNKAFVDITVAKSIEWLKRSDHNILDDLKKEARTQNRAGMETKVDEAEDRLDNGGTDVKDMALVAGWKQANQRIGMGFSGLKKVLNSGVLNLPASLQGAANSVIRGPGTGEPPFALLNWILDNNLEGSIAAATIYKGIGQRNQLMRDALGRDYIDPTNAKGLAQKLAPEGYTTWQPDEGNLLFTVKTLPEQVIDGMIDDTINTPPPDIDLDAWRGELEKAKTMLAMGGARYTMIVPDEVAATLNQLRRPEHEALWKFAIEAPVRNWKRWVLINPRRWLKYNLNNTVGDLDAVLAGNPKLLRRVPEAAKELFHVMRGAQPASERYNDALQRGVFDSGISIQEIPDINQFAPFERFATDNKAPSKLAMVPLRKTWNMLQSSTQWRENVFRYAAYLDYIGRLEAGEAQSSIGYGASLPTMVDAVEDTKDKAALLARDLIGDYGAISHFGTGVRKTAIPFWSWMEMNTKRYKRLTANAYSQGVGKGLATGSALAAAAGARTTARLAVQSMLIYGMINLWNHLFFPDEEDELDEMGQTQLHVILGRNEAGEIITLRTQGALSDALAWFGFDRIGKAFTEYERGRGSLAEILAAPAKATINRLATSLSPVITVPAETAFGKKFWPDVFNPRPNRDPWRNAAATLSLENELDLTADMTGFDKPSRGYGRSWADAVFYRRDPGEIAYNASRSITYDWLERVKGVEGDSTRTTPRSRATYDYKKAMTYDDKEAAQTAYDTMADLGMSEGDLEASIKRASPMGPIAKKDRKAFKDGLTPEEKNTMIRGIEWYQDTFDTTHE